MIQTSKPSSTRPVPQVRAPLLGANLGTASRQLPRSTFFLLGGTGQRPIGEFYGGFCLFGGEPCMARQNFPQRTAVHEIAQDRRESDVSSAKEPNPAGLGGSDFHRPAL